MKAILNLSISPAGCGHNKITCYCDDGSTLTTVTTNTHLTDRVKRGDPDEEDVREAKTELVELVLRDNGIEYETVASTNYPRHGQQWDIL